MITSTPLEREIGTTSWPASVEHARRRGGRRGRSLRRLRSCCLHGSCSLSHRCDLRAVNALDPPATRRCDRWTRTTSWPSSSRSTGRTCGRSPTGCSARSSEADDAVQEAWLRLSRADADDDRQPRRLADHGRRPRVPEHAALARGAARGAAGGRTCPTRSSAATTAVDPEHEALLADSVGLALLVVLETLDARRAAGVRAARHVRRAVRRDRADRRPLARPRRASSPAAPAAACRARRRRPTPTWPRQREVVDAFFAAARGGDFEALVAVLDPDVVLRADGGALRPEATVDRARRRERRVARAMTVRQPRAVRPPGAGQRRRRRRRRAEGRPFSVMALHRPRRPDRRDRRAGRPRAPARARPDARYD